MSENDKDPLLRGSRSLDNDLKLRPSRLVENEEGETTLEEPETYSLLILVVGIVLLLPVPFYCIGIFVLIFYLFYGRNKTVFGKNKIVGWKKYPFGKWKQAFEVDYDDIHSVSYTKTNKIISVLFLNLQVDDVPTDKFAILRSDKNDVKSQASHISHFLKTKFSTV